MKLQDLAERLADMASEVNRAVDQYAEDRIHSLCDTEEDGTLKPRILKYVPHPNAPVVTIPATSLTSMERLVPDRLMVKLEGEVDLEDECGVSFRNSLFKRSGRVKIEMEFKASPTSEALELVRDKANAVLGTELQVKPNKE